MNDENLKKLHNVELNILSEIDKICKKYNLVYSLYAGTQLGAIRHNGFIPWDDDMDICMERNDFEKFIECWYKENPEDYILQDFYKIKGITINHLKVMKKNTLFSNKEGINTPGYHAIFVDIFPFDRVPTSSLIKKKFKINAILRMIYTRGYPITRNGKFQECLSRLMLIIPKSLQTKIKNNCDRKIKKYCNYDGDYTLMDFSCPQMLSIDFPKDIFDNCVYTNFENYLFRISNSSDKMLTLLYGDYMKLPPLEERICKHNPEYLSFDTTKEDMAHE